VVFVDPYQGNNNGVPSLSLFLQLIKAYVELIGGRQRIHTCNAYIVKSNNGSGEYEAYNQIKTNEGEVITTGNVKVYVG
jgi:hypothetical protein